MRRVEVDWIDSNSRGGWIEAGAAKRLSTYDGMLHSTLGYVVSEGEHCLLLAMGCSAEDADTDEELLHDTFEIPNVAVVAIRDLRSK